MNADLRDGKPWRNRAYEETVKQKDRFPLQYEFLQQVDPQRLRGTVPQFELYDLSADPYEIRDLAEAPEHQDPLRRLYECRSAAGDKRQMIQQCVTTRDSDKLGSRTNSAFDSQQWSGKPRTAGTR